MNTPENDKLKQRARELRTNATEQERKLWYYCLKDYEVRFNRQKVFGNYIVDFYCSKAQLVVELDGSQHFDTVQIIYDQKRTSYLESLGLMVIRYTNYEINTQFYEVCCDIDRIVKERMRLNKTAKPKHRLVK